MYAQLDTSDVSVLFSAHAFVNQAPLETTLSIISLPCLDQCSSAGPVEENILSTIGEFEPDVVGIILLSYALAIIFLKLAVYFLFIWGGVAAQLVEHSPTHRCS